MQHFRRLQWCRTHPRIGKPITACAAIPNRRQSRKILRNWMHYASVPISVARCEITRDYPPIRCLEWGVFGSSCHGCLLLGNEGSKAGNTQYSKYITPCIYMSSESTDRFCCSELSTWPSPGNNLGLLTLGSGVTGIAKVVKQQCCPTTVIGQAR